MTDTLESWIGRTRVQLARLEPELAVRYAAAFGAPLDVGARFPPLGHWAYFNDAVDPSELGPDGHPRRGVFLPPIALPRRMFASSELRFEAPLTLGAEAELVTTIADIRRRSGRSGELILMDVDRRLNQDGASRIAELQTIAYREAGAPTPPVVDTGAAGGGEL
jgi:3-methylfumaryl-CoA hydratase